MQINALCCLLLYQDVYYHPIYNNASERKYITKKPFKLTYSKKATMCLHSGFCTIS